MLLVRAGLDLVASRPQFLEILDLEPDDPFLLDDDVAEICGVGQKREFCMWQVRFLDVNAGRNSLLDHYGLLLTR